MLGIDAKKQVPSSGWRCYVAGSGWVDLLNVTLELVGGWGAWRTSGGSEEVFAKFLASGRDSQENLNVGGTADWGPDAVEEMIKRATAKRALVLHTPTLHRQ